MSLMLNSTDGGGYVNANRSQSSTTLRKAGRFADLLAYMRQMPCGIALGTGQLVLAIFFGSCSLGVIAEAFLLGLVYRVLGQVIDRKVEVE